MDVGTADRTGAKLSLTLRYFAILREQRGLAEETIVTGSATPLDLYEELSSRYNFTLPASRIRVAVNGDFCDMGVDLRNGDTIVFVPPVAGG